MLQSGSNRKERKRSTYNYDDLNTKLNKFKNIRWIIPRTLKTKVGKGKLTIA
jgi:hypothetical protein